MTAAPIVIQAADNEFATEDVSAVFSAAEIPAQGGVVVAAGVGSRASCPWPPTPDHPETSGTILVLGPGAA
jgi:hypothetical protein